MFDIAIVEDEEMERRALRSILEKHVDDISIVGEARNGNEAVTLLDTRNIDLMLIDIRIPRPDGLEIIQMIRDRHLATKVLILTAHDYFELMQSAIHLKVDGFLLKPIRTAALLTAVRECLDDIAVTSKRETGIAGKIAALVDTNAYRDCLILVRRHIETVFAQKELQTRQAVLELSAALIRIAEDRLRRLPATLMHQVEMLNTQRLDSHNHYKVQELFSQIIDFLFDVTETQTTLAPQRVKAVLNYIERNLRKGVTLEEAAEFANVSPCYLSRLFHKEMGMTFVSYLRSQRIERAKELLLDSSMPISNVSIELSYQDANYFCKAFKKEVGVSPSEYRRQFQCAGASA